MKGIVIFEGVGVYERKGEIRLTTTFPALVKEACADPMAIAPIPYGPSVVSVVASIGCVETSTPAFVREEMRLWRLACPQLVTNW
jgi:hypothetical protein